LSRIEILPTPSEDEAAAILAVLELGNEDGPNKQGPAPESVSRWRTAARAKPARVRSRAGAPSAWVQAGRRYG